MNGAGWGRLLPAAARNAGFAAGLALPLLFLACCAQDRGDNSGLVARGEPPPYAAVARTFNENAEMLGSITADATGRVAFVERDGSPRQEQVEAKLQIIRPDRVSLALRKVSQNLFFLGCDAKRYWWVDVTLSDHTAWVGSHDQFSSRQAGRLGLSLPPLDLPRALGIIPLPDMGATQWSNDGRLLGVTTALSGGRRQRMWLEPESLVPMQVELFDSSGEVELVSALSRHEYVLAGGGGTPAKLAQVVKVNMPRAGTDLVLDLSDAQDGRGRIKDAAFDLEALLKAQQVTRVVDLDAAAPVRVTPARRQGDAGSGRP